MVNATRLSITMPARCVTVRIPAPPRFQVVSVGRQGPPGTLPPEVIEQVKEAHHAARRVDDMMHALTDAFSYHGGMIAAQEDNIL